MLYRNPIQAFKGIIKADGVRGLYWYEFWIFIIFSGMGANLLGVFPVQAITLASNDLFRDLLADENGNVSFLSSILAGAGAGGVQVIASNPMEITKIRLQIQADWPKSERVSMLDGIN